MITFSSIFFKYHQLLTEISTINEFLVCYVQHGSISKHSAFMFCYNNRTETNRTEQKSTEYTENFDETKKKNHKKKTIERIFWLVLFPLRVFLLVVRYYL